MTRKFLLCTLACLCFSNIIISAQERLDTIVPVRSFFIAAPKPEGVETFNKFIKEELTAQGVNTLVLSIGWNYRFQAHPELQDSNALGKEHIRAILETCRQNRITLIPHFNLLGHQSWGKELGNLLKAYPHFDETPNIKLPEEYSWPNADSLLCKSYCTQHPEVHKVVFACLDEILEAFEAQTCHVGLDLVYYIGHEDCQRCKGKDKAELYAEEIQRIHAHLKSKNVNMWMWGDRLLDGQAWGLNSFEGCYYGIHKAIDFIPKDIVICDWHYHKAHPTSILFASKGFHVISCAWHKPDVAKQQVVNLGILQDNSSAEIKNRLLGMMQTVWASPEAYIAEYHAASSEDTSVACFHEMFSAIKQMDTETLENKR